VTGIRSQLPGVDEQGGKKGVKKFTFHDIRAKSASDSASLQEASARLGHTSAAITDRVYMRVPYRVKPLK
jgi:integrase